MKIKQNKNKIGCDYHPIDTEKVFNQKSIYPDGICPWLYYSAYPYLLGLLYGANFKYKGTTDAWFMCPAENGCKALAKRRDITAELSDSRIEKGNTFVLFVEIISVGKCPKKHVEGQRFLFPTCMKKQFMCPAVWYQAFPLLNAEKPECINVKSVRCPDWLSDVTINIKE